MTKECTQSTGKLTLGGLPRKSVNRITNVTSAVYSGSKATNKKKTKSKMIEPRLTVYFAYFNRTVNHRTVKTKTDINQTEAKNLNLFRK